MNYYLDKNNPEGFSYKNNVLTVEERNFLYALFNMMDIKSINGEDEAQYGYRFNKKTSEVLEKEESIPKNLKKVYRVIKTRFPDADIGKINNCTINKFRPGQKIPPNIQHKRAGKKIVMLYIGTPWRYRMTNIHSSRCKHDSILYSGTCLVLKDGSRNDWTFETASDNGGVRILITFRALRS